MSSTRCQMPHLLSIRITVYVGARVMDTIWTSPEPAKGISDRCALSACHILTSHFVIRKNILKMHFISSGPIEDADS